MFKNRKYALLLATLSAACAFSHTNKDRELLVATWSQSLPEVSSLVGDLGKVVAKDKDSGMFLIALKTGLSADVALKELKSRKAIRFALPESARRLDTSNFYALDNYMRYVDDSEDLKGKSDEDRDEDKKGSHKRDKFDFYAALRYYLRGRVDANGYIDENAIKAAIVHKAQMPVAQLGPAQPSNPPAPSSIGTSWTFLGPNNTTYPYQEYYGTQTVSGRISAIAVDPTNASVIFAGSGGGGLWKSTNGGTAWACVSDKAPWKFPAVSCIAIDPLAHNTIYVGTGDYDGFFQGYNQGVMKSTDGGTTWTNLAAATTGIYNLCVSHIIVDPTNDNIITITTGRGSYSATYEGTGNVFRSTNGGSTWASAGLASEDFCTLDISAAGTGGAHTYWAGACLSPGSSEASLYKSTNQGATWVSVTPPDISYPTSSWELATSKVDANTLFVLDTGGQNVWKSTNSGSTWTSIATATFPVQDAGNSETNWAQSNYDYDIMTYAAPNAPSKEVLFVGLLTLAYSTNDGATWTDYGNSMNANTVLHSDQHQLAINPMNASQVLAGCDGGLFALKFTWSGATPTVTQTSLNSGLDITQLYAIAPHPTNANDLLTGAQDNAAPSALGNLSSWANPGAGDGGYCGWNIPYSYFFTTYDQGGVQTYDLSGNQIGSPDPNGVGNQVAFIAPTVLSESGKYLFFATNYMLTVDGTNPNATSYSTSSTLLSNGYYVNAIGTAPSNDLVVYSGSAEGEIFYSSNHGQTFTEIDNGTLPQNYYSVGAISVSTTNPNDILVGYQNTGITHLWRCAATNGAKTWVSVSGSGSTGLPDIPVNAIARDYANPATTWYVGTDNGVFMTKNSGSTWANVDDNMPAVQVFDLKVVGTNLFVGTFGRGVWKIPLNSTSDSISTLEIETNFPSPDTSPVGTVVLTAVAPSGGQAYTATSSNTSVAQVPASGTVPAGLLAHSFYIINQYVSSPQTITLTATVNNVSKSVSYTVKPPVPQYIYVTANSLTGGAGDLSAVQLNGNAPPAGAVVSLKSSNTALATVNPTMTIGGGARRANFVITTKAVTVKSTVTITATYDGGSASMTITLNP